MEKLSLTCVYVNNRSLEKSTSPLVMFAYEYTFFIEEEGVLYTLQDDMLIPVHSLSPAD